MMRAFIYISILFFHTFGFAQEVRRFYVGARGHAMGGAQIATVNDETALLVNPAALGKLRDSYGTLIDPDMDFGNNLSAMFKGAKFSNPWSLNNIKWTTRTSPGSYYHAQAQLFPSFVARNFGIGIYKRDLVNAIYDFDTEKITAHTLDDLAIVMGFNLSLWEGRIKFGVTGKYISRIEIDSDQLDVNNELTAQNYGSEGAAVAVDAGLILTAPWTTLPTLTAVIRDVGGTSFTSGGGLRMNTATKPQKLDQDIDVGFSFFPLGAGNKTRGAVTAEYSKIIEASKAIDKQRYMHAGFEINYADLIFLRAGMNQRYWTAGIELASEHTQIQVSTYGEDVGQDGSPTEDRRTVLKFAFRF